MKVIKKWGKENSLDLDEIGLWNFLNITIFNNHGYLLFFPCALENILRY